MEWLNDLPSTKQEEIVRMAMKNKDKVAKTYQEHKDEVSQKRQDHLVQMHKEREIARQKKDKEIEKLSKIHLVTSISELNDALFSIDENPNFSKAKKKGKKNRITKRTSKISKTNVKTKYQDSVH